MGVDVGGGRVVNHRVDKRGNVHTDNPSHAKALASIGDSAVVSSASRRSPSANIKDEVQGKFCPLCSFQAWAFTKACPRCGSAI